LGRAPRDRRVAPPAPATSPLGSFAGRRARRAGTGTDAEDRRPAPIPPLRQRLSPLSRQGPELAGAAGEKPDRRLSIARQLGLAVSRIVIDAGHGGHDPGAKARASPRRSSCSIVALRLEKLLQKKCLV